MGGQSIPPLRGRPVAALDLTGCAIVWRAPTQNVGQIAVGNIVGAGDFTHGFAVTGRDGPRRSRGRGLRISPYERLVICKYGIHFCTISNEYF
jgi:hypothetical protein